MVTMVCRSLCMVFLPPSGGVFRLSLDGVIAGYYSERIYLDQICRYANLSKSTLLRAFTKSKGITPYRYLETIRINEAKALLEKGMQPIDAAMQTGFSDQSHFTNYFSSFIGLAPGVYRDIFSNKDGEQHGE